NSGDQRTDFGSKRMMTLHRATICSLLGLGSGLASRRMYQVSHANADEIQHNHGRSEDAHIHNIGRRGDDSRNCKYDEDGIPQISPEPASRDDSHQSQKENKYRQLENNSKAHN